MSDLSNYRKSYEKSELLEDNIPQEPFTLYKSWFADAEASGTTGEVNAMTLSTKGLDGYPNSRIVLLKSYDTAGFTFFTNYDSDKGKAIEANPNVCLSFFWQGMERQVIIKGQAEKTSDTISNNYFDSRPDGSKMGAWASGQSDEVVSRQYLDDRLQVLEHEFAGKEIPRPPHWGGYLVRPITIEFWQGRRNRMHDRIRYVLQANGNWKIIRLAP